MSVNYRNIKAQTTIFILISLVIVIIGAFVLYTSDVELFYSPQDRADGQIKESIEYCIDQSMGRGIFYLQSQGGVINTSSYIRFRDDYLQLGESESAFKLPNWDVEDDQYPTVFSMENELNQYVKQDSQGCINLAITTLSDAYQIDVNYDEFEVFTDIDYETVSSQAFLPLEYKQINGELKNSLNEFVVERDSKLGDLYELAIEIYNLEEETYLFEDLTLDQIFSASNYGDRTTSMPSQGIEFSCTPRIWLKSDLRDTLAQLNNNNFRYLEFEGTAPIDYRFESNLGVDSPNEAYFRNFYSYELLNTKPSFRDYEVNVLNPAVESFVGGYSRYNPYREFEISPSEGEIVRSMEQGVDTGFGRFNFGCIQIFAHSYTLDYDLMINLKDVSGESQDFFQFPLRVSIKQNEPKESTSTLIIAQDQIPTLTESSYCQEQTYEYPVDVSVENVNAPFEDQYLSNVNISFKCLGLTCDLGETKQQVFRVSNQETEVGYPVYSGNVPYCFGGRFIAKKEGFFQLPLIETFPGQRDLSDYGENPLLVSLQMVPTKSFSFNQDSFEGREWREDVVSNAACYTISDERDVDVFIQIENMEYDFQSSALYSKGEELPEELTTLEFLVMDNVAYNVSAFYMKDDELIGLFEEENWIPDVEFSSSINVVIPIAASLDDDMFLEYYEGSKELYGELAHCIGAKSTPFGVSLR